MAFASRTRRSSSLDAPVLVFGFVQAIFLSFCRSQELLQRRLVIIARGDELGQRVHRRVGHGLEIVVEIVLEFPLLHVEVGGQLAGVERCVLNVHQNCALLLQHLERSGHHAD